MDYCALLVTLHTWTKRVSICEWIHVGKTAEGGHVGLMNHYQTNIVKTEFGHFCCKR